MYLVTFVKSSSQKQKLKLILKPDLALFESIKEKSKKNYYHNLLITNENGMKRTWATIKEIIGSKKLNMTLFPKQLVVNDLELFDNKTMVKNFNKLFSEI